MSPEPDISRLVARAQAGEAEAFGLLYDAYAQRVYRFILAQVREPADAEDLTQQVFTNVLGSLSRYQDRGLPFGAWLFRIVRHAIADRARTAGPPGLSGEISEVVRDDTHLSELAERAAERADVRAALATLTTDQRDVVVLRFFAGLPHREIGLLLGKPEASVRVLQFRALAALRRTMNGDTSRPVTREATS